MKDKIEKMINKQGMGFEEIAEELFDEDCVQSFGGTIPSYCGEDADCYNCWLSPSRS